MTTILNASLCFLVFLLSSCSATSMKSESGGILSRYDLHPKVFLVEDLSNPSGIAFDKAVDGKKRFWVVVDQSGIQDNTQLFEIILSPGSHLVEVGKKVSLSSVCDLEGVTIDRRNSTFILADERVKDYEREDVSKRSALRKFSVSGDEVFSQEVQEFTHQGNNGLEGVAIRSYPGAGEIRIYALREYLQGDEGVPEILVYNLTDNSFVLIDSFQIDDPLNTNQSGAHFDQESGHLLIVSKTQRKILEIDPDKIHDGKVKVIASLDYREFVNSHIRREESKYGIVEGITMDDEGNIYAILDNNKEEIGDGTSAALEISKHPRILMFRRW